MNRVTTLIFALLTIIIFSSPIAAKDESAASVVFNELKSLKGIWQKQGAKNSTFRIQFEILANDSVLVETWLHEGRKHSLTLYHFDGDNLVATHYCPQGNQPRLRLTQSKNNLATDK